jgi:secreted protein with Ig-like and vWFA domain
LEIVESTADRLALRLKTNIFSTGHLDFDRNSDVTTITWLAVVIPYLRKQFPVSTIRDVSVRRRGRRKLYSPVLNLGLGRTISIGDFTKDDAFAAARAIRDFLQAQKSGGAFTGATSVDESATAP